MQRIYDEGMHRSQAPQLAHALMDSIGPRLTGSPQNRAANDWLVHTYASWGITAKNEQYGTWRNWTRGPSRIEMLAPRVRTLEATMLAWSASTPPAGVTAEIVAPPPASETHDSAGFAHWVASTKGKIVLASAPQVSCRPESSWEMWGGKTATAALTVSRDSARREWAQRTAAAGASARNIIGVYEQAGVAGVLTNSWSSGWGVDKIQSARAVKAPQFDVSCEDYSLLARLIASGVHPRVTLFASATMAPAESPVFNTIATVRGSEKPDEYVMLSAHQDSWDSGSGATDNGTGTLVMLEAMRILHAAYPSPKRTIIAGHWSGEEEGDIGSGAYAADHPEILKGLQALFNQDNGTGNIDTVQVNGFTDALPYLQRWLGRAPADLTAGISPLTVGVPHDESTDSDAFDCHDAPAFFLTTADWDYTDYTWHTNRDTYDKISFDNVRRTATLIAMLAYQASEEPTLIPRTRVAPSGTGRGGRAPTCGTPRRSFGGAPAGRGRQ
jgi:hypothetical protein